LSGGSIILPPENLTQISPKFSKITFETISIVHNHKANYDKKVHCLAHIQESLKSTVGRTELIPYLPKRSQETKSGSCNWTSACDNRDFSSNKLLDSWMLPRQSKLGTR
jgi:hypothetical protein